MGARLLMNCNGFVPGNNKVEVDFEMETELDWSRS